MPFQLEQVSPNVSQIELKTFFNQVFETDSKLTTEYFSLGRLNPLVSYTGGCSLYIKPIIKQDVRTYSVKLSLRWYRRPVIHHDEQQSSPEIHHLPRAISVSVNGGETRKLKLDACRSFDRGFWEADEFVVSSKDLPNGIGQLQPFPLTLKFLVEFESSFSLSEKNALKEFTDLFVKQIDCDVQFCFPASNKLIGGHVNILSARSPVLKQAIIASKIIRIEDQMDIFQHFLLFIYSGQILVPLTEERAQSLYKLAEKYCVNDLKESCVDFLISCFRKDNIWQLIAFADTHSIDKLKKAANAFKELSVREIQMAALKGNATSVAQPMNQTVPGGVSGQTDVKLHAAPSLARPSTSGCKPPKKCSCVMCENLAPSALNVAKPTIPPATPLKPAMPQIASPTKTSTGNDLPKASVLPASVVVKSETVLHPKEPDVERKEPEVLKTETAPATKKPTATNNPLHPPYLEMITTAIGKLKERSGSSRQALLKYILSNYTLGVDAKMANVHLKQALKRGVNSGVLWNTKVSSFFLYFIIIIHFAIIVRIDNYSFSIREALELLDLSAYQQLPIKQRNRSLRPRKSCLFHLHLKRRRLRPR